MSKDKAPREFWINQFENDVHEVGTPFFGGKDGRTEQPVIHVIEKSAYDSLEAKLKKLENDIEIAGDYCSKIVKARVDELGAKLAECVAALTIMTTEKGRTYQKDIELMREVLAKVKKMSDETYETKPGEIIAMKLRSEIDALKAELKRMAEERINKNNDNSDLLVEVGELQKENAALRESLKEAVQALESAKFDFDMAMETKTGLNVRMGPNIERTLASIKQRHGEL